MMTIELFEKATKLRAEIKELEDVRDLYDSEITLSYTIEEPNKVSPKSFIFSESQRKILREFCSNRITELEQEFTSLSTIRDTKSDVKDTKPIGTETPVEPGDDAAPVELNTEEDEPDIVAADTDEDAGCITY